MEQVTSSVTDDLEIEEEASWQRWVFFSAAAEVETQVEETSWRAFWGTAVEGLPAKAVARELGVCVGTVYSAKCRVLAKIRRKVAILSGEVT